MDWFALVFNIRVLIGFALYSKKACSLINPFDAGAVNVIRLTPSFISV